MYYVIERQGFVNRFKIWAFLTRKVRDNSGLEPITRREAAKLLTKCYIGDNDDYRGGNVYLGSRSEFTEDQRYLECNWDDLSAPDDIVNFPVRVLG